MPDLRLGPPIGAPGVVVYQREKTNTSLRSIYGSAAVYGVIKRGPMGVAVPVYGAQDYQEKFGDPQDRSWHLYSKSEHLTPDWIDGFFAAGGGVGAAGAAGAAEPAGGQSREVAPAGADRAGPSAATPNSLEQPRPEFHRAPRAAFAANACHGAPEAR